MNDEQTHPSGNRAAELAKKAVQSVGAAIGEQSQTGEGRVALAGAVVFGVWVIFDVVFQAYGLENTLAVLALVSFVLPRLKAGTLAQIDRAVAMKALGYLIALFGGVELVLDVRNGILDETGAALGAIIGYFAYVLAFFGARAINAGGAPPEPQDSE